MPLDTPGGGGAAARELERIGPDGADAVVLGLAAPGFEDLSPRQRALCYHLGRAAIAGDRIFADQTHRRSREAIRLFEAILLHADQLDGRVRGAVHEHLKWLWINHGFYDHDNHVKRVPRELTPEMLQDAARHALARGAPLGAPPGVSLEEHLESLRPHLFDPDHEPLQTNQSGGADILATSAVNLYDRGLTEPMLAALPAAWTRRINVRFGLSQGRAVPEVYRIGGRYGEDLATVSWFLEQAVPLAESRQQREGLLALLDFYRTGEEEAFRRHTIHWLSSDTAVDYLNGFIEQYHDPRGVIGQFGANVSIASESRLIGLLADSASYFERRMPWPDRFKRETVPRPAARVVEVLVETGDAGPCSPAAYNLPNDADLRQRHGSRNVVLRNVEAARSPSVQERMIEEFYLPHVRDVMRRRFDTGRLWTVFMHEVIGHGSGRVDPELEGNPRTRLGRVYSALEECRADLVALYHIFDPRLVEIGAFQASEQEEVILAAYLGHLQGHLVRYRSLPEDTVREAHRRGAELLLQYLTRGGEDGRRDFGVRLVRTGGNHYVDLPDPRRAREGVGELLGRLQTLKSTGDAAGAADLFDRFGTRLDPDIRRNVIERASRLRLPRVQVYVFPRLEPVMREGVVVDATLHQDEDLTTQQLRFARLQLSRAIP